MKKQTTFTGRIGTRNKIVARNYEKPNRLFYSLPVFLCLILLEEPDFALLLFEQNMPEILRPIAKRHKV